MSSLILLGLLMVGQSNCPGGVCPAPTRAGSYAWYNVTINGQAQRVWGYLGTDGQVWYVPVSQPITGPARPVADPTPVPVPDQPPVDKAPAPELPREAKPDEATPVVDPPANFGLDLEAMAFEARELGANQLETNDPNLGAILASDPAQPAGGGGEETGGLIDPHFNVTVPPVVIPPLTTPALILAAGWVISRAMQTRSQQQ
jgi:hypothetical protein